MSPHPNLPLVREDFFDGDRYVIAMDWVDGIDLARVLQTRGRPGLAPTLVMNWMADAAAALTHLHTQTPPVVHGDVKPANLILGRGRARDARRLRRVVDARALAAPIGNARLSRAGVRRGSGAVESRRRRVHARRDRVRAA